jgi:hypothetical protein
MIPIVFDTPTPNPNLRYLKILMEVKEDLSDLKDNSVDVESIELILGEAEKLKSNGKGDEALASIISAQTKIKEMKKPVTAGKTSFVWYIVGGVLLLLITAAAYSVNDAEKRAEILSFIDQNNPLSKKDGDEDELEMPLKSTATKEIGRAAKSSIIEKEARQSTKRAPLKMSDLMANDSKEKVAKKPSMFDKLKDDLEK